MASLFDAINAAAAAINNSEQTPQPPLGGEAKRPKVQPRAASGKTPSDSPSTGSTKAQTKTDTPKTKGGAKYVIPAEFKQAIENHLKGRADMAGKLNAKGKSIEGCCDYIFDVMRKRAEKERKGQSAVGLYAEPKEIFGLAVHYYDESEESLKAEANS